MCSRYWADNVACWGLELEVGGSGGLGDASWIILQLPDPGHPLAS